MDADFLKILTEILSGVLVLLLPGYVWVTWVPAVGESPIHRLADAIGLSLALNALAAFLAFLLQIRFYPFVFFAFYAVLAVLGCISLALYLRQALFSMRVWLRRLQARPVAEEKNSHSGEAHISVGTRQGAMAGVHLLVLLVMGGLVAWRLYQTKELVLPAWVDSLHHVLIVRLFLETGGVPESFLPYMPVPFYYHFTFHQTTALFALWSRLAPAQAVLVLGQVLNAAVALSVFRLGLALWHDWRRAGVAGLLVGFVSQMPAYYATWGRYTLLVGLILLPLAMAQALEISRLGWDRKRVARLALLTAGSLFSHYFTALLLALFLAFLSAAVLFSRQRSERHLTRTLSALFWAGLLGLVIATPWLLRVWENARAYTSLTTVALSDSLDTIFFSDYLNYLTYLLGPQRNYVLLALAGLGMIVSGWRRGTRTLTVWSLVLGVIGIPWGINLSPFRPDHALIVLFLPVTLLIANGLITIFDRLKEGRLAVPGGLAVGAVLISLLAWGIKDTRQIINPVTVLADRADARAVAWVEENTPQEARFLINVTPWQIGVYRGVDGGWWILPLTGRRTIVPPSMYVLGEPAFVSQTNAWAEQAMQLQGCTPAFWNLVRDAGIDHLYLRAGKGSLQAEELEGCGGLVLAYDQEGVVIYRVR